MSLITQHHKLVIGDIIAKIPIIQGGMGVGISLSGLAAAVADEGGIGVIATPHIGMFEEDFNKNFREANKRALENEIRKARAKTKGIIGVNIMVALTNFSDLVETAITEKADIIFCGAGLPLDLPKYIGKNTKTKIVPIISSARAVELIARHWKNKHNYYLDAVVVEGPMAGGHLGFKKEQITDPAFALEKLVPEVIEILRPYGDEKGCQIPVIAAGGIYTGADIYKFLRLGALGVQMATRFVTTFECDAPDSFKQAYINATAEDLQIIDSPVGLPGRAIRNEFLNKVNCGEKKPFSCIYHCLKPCDFNKVPYCIALALCNAKKGLQKNSLIFAGANAYRAEKIISVSELFRTIKQEYFQASSMN